MKPQKPVGSEDTGACGWDTARFDTSIRCVQYGPAGDVIAAGVSAGRIHFICAQTGEKLLCPLRDENARSRLSVGEEEEEEFIRIQWIL